MSDRNTIRNLAEKVRRMGEAEIGNIMVGEDFSKQELMARYVQIGESRDLYSLLNLKDPIRLRLEEDRNKIWIFAYLIETKGIKILPVMNDR